MQAFAHNREDDQQEPQSADEVGLCLPSTPPTHRASQLPASAALSSPPVLSLQEWRLSHPLSLPSPSFHTSSSRADHHHLSIQLAHYSVAKKLSKTILNPRWASHRLVICFLLSFCSSLPNSQPHCSMNEWNDSWIEYTVSLIGKGLRITFQLYPVSFLSIEYKLELHRKRNLNWENTAIKLAWRQICRMLSWLMIDAERPSLQEVVPLLGKQSWVVEESKLSKPRSQ